MLRDLVYSAQAEFDKLCRRPTQALERDNLGIDRTKNCMNVAEIIIQTYLMDCNELRKKLKGIVEEFIKTHQQSVNTSITLNDKMISGGTSHSYKTVFSEIVSDKDNIYVTNHRGRYTEICDKPSKMLIKHAILPLKLKWHVCTVNSSTAFIEINWDHWDVN